MMTVPEPDGEIEVASRRADELVFPNLHDEQQELNQHPVARTSMTDSVAQNNILDACKGHFACLPNLTSCRSTADTTGGSST